MNGLNLSDKFLITPTGLQVIGNPTFDEWEAFGQVLWGIRSAVQWSLADWIQYGEDHWEDKYSQAMDETKQSYQTLANIVWVASRFPASRRRGSLSFSHHEAVAAIPDISKQDELLTRATVEKMNRDEIRALAKPHKPARPVKIAPPPPPPIIPVATQTSVPVIGAAAEVFAVNGAKATLMFADAAMLDALREAQRCGYPVYVMIQRTSKRPQFTPIVDAMNRFGRKNTRLVIAEEKVS